ncbi:MAG TPA: response regulator [Vicinamibacterales bacterium]|nr:response regulator [Vicinamibacterales bacterium]
MPGSAGAPILIVEDDRNALSGYIEYLTDAGYEVVGVPDGSAALPVAATRGASVVVTDIALPGMDGFDLTVALRAAPLTQDVPVIGLTANWSRETHVRAAAVQMVAVLRKPCLPSHLVAELERVLAGERPERSRDARRI